MTPNLLDFSRRRELALHASIVASVTAVAAPLGIATIIVGAFARDLHLLYRHNIETQRQTEDIDFALAVRDWPAFEALKERLISSGAFRPSNVAHRMQHRMDLPIDLLPFGNVETSERKIAWPPRGEVVMDVFGFREALANAHDVALPGNVRTKVVSLPALALLKIVCWQDRHYQSPRKDAHDLHLILRNYLHAGNEQRLWDEFPDWAQEGDFQYELAGARMLGHDMRKILDGDGIRRVGDLLAGQTGSREPALLPSEMNADEPDKAKSLLDAMLNGLLEN